MNAKYYRFLFQNVEDGVCHTGSIVDTYEKKEYHFIYISGLKDSLSSSSVEDERFSKVQEYQLVVLADLCAFSIHKVVRVLRQSKVVKVVLPKFDLTDLKVLAKRGKEEGIYSEEELSFIDEPYAFLKNAGVQEICEVEKDIAFVCNDWQFIIAAFGKGIDTNLVMYHGSFHLDKKLEDCVMAVKCFTEEETCNVCVNPELSSCGMKCVLYNDFDICKKHNGMKAQEYIDGTLLLGTVDLKKNFNEIQNLFKGVSKKIRFISIPNGGNQDEWNKEILKIGTKSYKQYFVGPKSDCQNANTIRDIGMSSPYQQFMVTSNKFGLCCSGFYKHREDN